MDLLWGVPNRIGGVDVFVTRVDAASIEVVVGSQPHTFRWRTAEPGTVISFGHEKWRITRLLPDLDTHVTLPGTTLEAPIAAELERVETE